MSDESIVVRIARLRAYAKEFWGEPKTLVHEDVLAVCLAAEQAHFKVKNIETRMAVLWSLLPKEVKDKPLLCRLGIAVTDIEDDVKRAQSTHRQIQAEALRWMASKGWMYSDGMHEAVRSDMLYLAKEIEKGNETI